MISYPVVVDGVLTRVLEAGGGDECVVFLHGGNSNANRWRGPLERLSGEGFRLLAFDLPGHGFAVNCGDLELGVPAFEKYLGGLLEALEIERPILVGASLGGHVAGAYTSRRPEAVQALVLVGTAGVKNWDLDDRIRIWKMNTNVTREGVATSLRHLVQGRFEPTATEIEEEFRLKSNPLFQRNMAAMTAYMTNPGWEDDLIADVLAKVTPDVPTYIIWGGDDHSFPAEEWARDIHDVLPGSHLAVIEGGGHNPFLDQPEVFDLVLADILHGRYGTHPEAGVTYS